MALEEKNPRNHIRFSSNQEYRSIYVKHMALKSWLPDFYEKKEIVQYKFFK